MVPWLFVHNFIDPITFTDSVYYKVEGGAVGIAWILTHLALGPRSSVAKPL